MYGVLSGAVRNWTIYYHRPISCWRQGRVDG
ncbi:hypothetical protein DP44_793 [Burkholderia pseudomallei]|nr:hypothetical protein DP44_793 [Burkholderia pseudomallei]